MKHLIIGVLLSSISSIAYADGVVATFHQRMAVARALFAEATTDRRVDCDPVAGGWVCANIRNPTMADVTGTVDEPVVTPAPSPVVSVPVSSTRIAAFGVTISIAREVYKNITNAKRKDCDPVSGGWVCANFRNPTLDDVSNVDAPPVTTTPPVVTPPVTTTPGDTGLIPSDALFSIGDFISIHHDNGPDYDDMHSGVADHMVADYYGLRRGTDYAVVSGTISAGRPRTVYRKSSELVFDTIFGKAGSMNTWLNYFENESSTISTIASKWKTVLEAGNKVWVLDGGPSDATALIIRALERQGANVNYKNITVIQHSTLANEKYTNAANLAYIKSKAVYMPIPDGNWRNANAPVDTPDLNLNNALAAKYMAEFKSNAVYGDEWTVAINTANIHPKLDASDTVELLWALGITYNDIKD